MIAGVTPDGAADGQCGLGLIPTIAPLVDTCQLHQLQRGVLISLGLAGSVTKNTMAKVLLRKHNRVVMLSRQSLAVGKAIRDAQHDADVPDHKLLALQPTATTRWGNQYSQLAVNNTLRLAIDPAVDKFKRDNRSNKEAIVESNESEQGSKVGIPVPASELGIDRDDWDDSLELESLYGIAYDVKETIEKRGHCTGAQGLMLLYDLSANACHSDASLTIKEFPSSLRLSDRERVETTKPSDDLSPITHRARELLREELTDRLLHGGEDRRPSNSRLIQCYMSKQMKSSEYLPPAWNVQARTLYLQALRTAAECVYSRAATVVKQERRTSPRKQQKVVTGGLFRGAQLLTTTDSPTAPAPANDESSDPMLDELRRWDGLGQDAYKDFISPDGLLNEFAMMWALRERFPLHFHVFKQTACHLPHEANVEQIFSRAGLLSDPNLDPLYLATLVKVAVNKRSFKPTVDAIKKMYFTMFRGRRNSDDNSAEMGDAELPAHAPARPAEASPSGSHD